MSEMPPSGSRTVPSRARKSPSGALGDAFRSGMDQLSKEPQHVSRPEDEEPKKKKEPKESKGPQVRIAKSTYSNLITTKILRGLGFGLISVLILYVFFAATIVRIIPSTEAGLIPTKNITFYGGIVPQGELIVVDMVNPQGTDVLDYLRQAFIPNPNVAIVRAEAGPWGTFEWNEGTVTFDGKIVDMNMPNQPEDTALTNRYLVTCIEGACVPGEGYIIPNSNIMGQPLR